MMGRLPITWGHWLECRFLGPAPEMLARRGCEGAGNLHLSSSSGKSRGNHGLGTSGSFSQPRGSGKPSVPGGQDKPVLPKTCSAFPLRWGSPGNHEEGTLCEEGSLSLGTDLRGNREAWVGAVRVSSLSPVLATGAGWGLLVCGGHRAHEASRAFWGHTF